MKLLFLCVANSARSQMAEGLAKSIFKDSVTIQSAGSFPSYVHPIAIEVMSEVGIDISDQKSQSVESIDPNTVDTVVTLCQEEVCPAFLGKAKRLHWAFPDPGAVSSEEEAKERFRNIRDGIKGRLLEEFEEHLRKNA